MTAASPRVFVIGATIPAGGTWMAYNVGRILKQMTGYPLYNVHFGEEVLPSLFHYDAMESIALDDLSATLTDHDFVIANPSFSPYVFRHKLRGRKIMYVQDFRTFQFLDCQFDHYVCVGSVAQHFIENVYGINAPIIPPFIDISPVPAPTPWQNRAPLSFLVYTKTPNDEHLILKNTVTRFLHDTYPGGVIDTIDGRSMPHAEFLNALQRSRYVINLSIAEGFGLIPLEAMALGCTVMGLDGTGGRDYMRHGENSMTIPFKDFIRVLPIIKRVVEDDALAERLSAQAIEDAKAYGYEIFKMRWMTLLEEFLR